MANMRDFLVDSNNTVDDFYVEEKVSAGVNEATSNTHAAYAASLTSNDAEGQLKAYSQVKGEFKNLGTSPTIDSIRQEVSQREIVKQKQAVTALVGDENAPFEQKKLAVDSLINSMNNRGNMRQAFSQQLMEKESTEDSEQEIVRLNTGAILDQVDELKRQQQALVNAYQQQVSDSALDKVIDIAELITPFQSSARIADIAGKVDGAGAATGAMFLAGSAKKDIIEKMRSMSIEEQMDFSQQLYDYITEEDVVLPDENDLDNLSMIEDFLGTGTYSDLEVWADNAFSLLDLTILGGALARAGKFLKTGRSATSPASIAKDTNPDTAKSFHAAVVADESGETAQALYGTDRTSAIVDDLAPEIGEADGSVRNKVGGLADFDLIKRTKDEYRIYLTDEEKASAIEPVINDFKAPLGMSVRSEMSSIEATESGARIRAVYGTPEGAYADPVQALDMAREAFKKYGLDEDNVELLMQTGDIFMPVDKADARNYVKAGWKAKTNFLVRVNHEYEVNTSDITDWSSLDVKLNFFDRLNLNWGGHGSLQSHVLDAQSTLSNQITKGAIVAEDRAAFIERKLMNVASEYTNLYHGLDKEQKAKVAQYLDDANNEGLSFNRTDLVARGMDEEAIQSVQAWRKLWDTHYYLENRERATQLRSQGYQMFRDTQGTKMVAKPVGLNKVSGQTVKVLDKDTGRVLSMKPQEVEELYRNEGTLGRLVTPHVKDKEAAEFIVSRENADGYFRALNNDDEVLAYREGYYSVQYDAPMYVVERVKDKGGKVLFERAVATAKNTDEADLAARRLATTSGRVYDNDIGDADIFVRRNVKGESVSDADYWSLQTLGGRSAQRLRGKRLTDTRGDNSNGISGHLIDPAKLIENTARSIANRAPMREYLESTKARFLKQYNDILPRDQWDQPRMPHNSTEIGRAGQKNTKQAADARTTFEYLRSMEDGYINAIDDGLKAILRTVEGAASEKVTKSVGTKRKVAAAVEASTRAVSDIAPTQQAKRVAFNLYLALNPLRQLVIQSMQALNVLAVSPSYMLSGRYADDMGALIRYALDESYKPKTEAAKQLVKDWESSGLGAAVDRQNLVREGAKHLADMSYGQSGQFATALGKVTSIGKDAVTYSRKLGFDAGEGLTMMSNFAAARQAEIAKGSKGAKVAQEAGAKARSLTLNMNRGGDMPYNRNSLNLVFQFAQVPHKAITQVLFNRNLSKAERAKLGTYYSAMFGLPLYSVITSTMPKLIPEDEEVRDAIELGLMPLALNTGLSLVSNTETDIDFSSLAPYDSLALYQTFSGIFTSDIGTAISESPSGSLFFGSNPRVTNAIKTAVAFAGGGEFDGTPVEFSQVMLDVAKMSSGFSNGYKSWQMHEYSKRYSSMGDVTDQEITTPEAYAASLGFSTRDEAVHYAVNTELYDNRKEYENDFNNWYKETKRILAGQNINSDTSLYYSRMIQAAAAPLRTNMPMFYQLFRQKLKYDVEVDKDSSFMDNIFKASGFLEKEELRSLVLRANYEDPNNKQILLDFIDNGVQEIKENE